MTKEILRAEKIQKSFYRPQKIKILQEINLTVKAGETVAITGRSGQGKTTLLQILGTLEPHCKGHLQIAGQPVTCFTKSAIRRKNISFIFQSFHLLEDYSALENVLMPAKIARLPVSEGSEAYLRALNLLEHVGLIERAHFNTKLLSGGEKQRVAIARALCNDPDLIFADEPSGNLDQQTSATIHSLLMDFVDRQGKALIVVTHNPQLAAMCSHHYELQDGYLHPK